MRGPTYGGRIVLHLERSFLRIVNHPKEHGVYIHRHGVAGQRLFSREGGRDYALIYPGRDLIDKWNKPEETRPSQADVLAQPKDHGAFPLPRDFRRLRQQQSQQQADNRAARIQRPKRGQRPECDRRQKREHCDKIEPRRSRRRQIASRLHQTLLNVAHILCLLLG